MARPPAPLPLHELRLDARDRKYKELVRFAVVARIDALIAKDGSGVDTRSELADALGESAPTLLKRLRPEYLAENQGAEFVKKLQLYLVRERHAELAGTGHVRDLVSFRSSVLEPRQGLTSHISVPASYFVHLATADGAADHTGRRYEPARTNEELHLRLAALAELRQQAADAEVADALYLAVNNNVAPPVMELVRDPDAKGERDHGPADDAIREAVSLVCIPHPRATITLGLLAQLREWSLPALADAILHSPVGWRAARVLTRALRIYETGDERVLGLIRECLNAAGGRSDRYRVELDLARGFLEEALRRSPGDTRSWKWGSWVPVHLTKVARDATRMPIRLRLFAIQCLAERDETRERARNLLQMLQAEMEADGDDSGALEHGIITLTRHLDGDRKDPRSVWPWLDTPAYRFLSGLLALPAALASIDSFDPAEHPVLIEGFDIAEDNPLKDLPRTVRCGAVILVLHALLSPDITIRRAAADCLAAAGAAGVACELIAGIAARPDCPLFLAEIAAVVMGYIGEPVSAPALATLSRRAKVRRGKPAESKVSLARTAIMALAELHSVTEGDRDEVWAAITEALAHPRRIIRASAVYAAATRSIADRTEIPDAVHKTIAAQAEQVSADGKPDLAIDVAGWCLREPRVNWETPPAA